MYVRHCSLAPYVLLEADLWMQQLLLHDVNG